MKIKWMGHSCFLLTSDEGVRVLADPFDPKIGFPAPVTEADIVTVSHQHSDHNYTQAVKGKFKLFDQPGSFSERGVDILGVPSFHDDQGGTQRGKNILFRLTLDGLNVLHCGDLGHELTPEQIAALAPVDVLLLPVGGYYTIDAATAVDVMHQLRPALVIPMHFKTGKLDFPITTVEPFLQAAGGGKEAGAQEVEITQETLAQLAGVLVLDHP